MTNFFIPTIKRTNKPGWSYRNEKISSFINENSAVLDLGCGSKDLLRYIRPSKYIGVDYNNELADVRVNFNSDFSLPDGRFDYIICSGLLEYLENVDLFLSKIKNKSENYIITFWDNFKEIDNPHMPTDFKIKDLLLIHFDIIEQSKAKLHNIYVCKDKQ